MNRFFKMLMLFVIPYFAFVFYLAYLGQSKIAQLPAWIWWVALCYLIIGIVSAGFWRTGKRAGDSRSSDTDVAFAGKALKGVLVVYILIVLNAIQVVTIGTVPRKFSVPVLVFVVAIAIVLWRFSIAKARSSPEHKGNS
jgi:hypothetical protein